MERLEYPYFMSLIQGLDPVVDYIELPTEFIVPASTGPYQEARPA
jgi:hypothetical protein